MANLKEDGIFSVTFRANEDLSAKQYYCAAPASTANYVNVADGASNPTPIGVIQDDNADTVGDAVQVKMWGLTKAVVAACDLVGNACVMAFGHFLVAGSDGKLYAAGSGTDISATARALESVTTETSAIISVFFMPNSSGSIAAGS
jgi:hypothetical protein